ncbi:hypothetical protein FACS1894104_1460 [Actinomycetota bacterium]|nr:hypothetical protein FACS1894104_1460 [Actinomycetota bacterium]
MKYSYRKMTLAATIAALLLVLPLVLSTAFAEESDQVSQEPAAISESEQTSIYTFTEILAMDDRELVVIGNTLIADAGFNESLLMMQEKVEELSGDEVHMVANAIRGKYLSEHPDEQLATSESETSGDITTQSSSGPTGIWHAGGAYSVGIGAYPTTKGKILVTADWAW